MEFVLQQERQEAERKRIQAQGVSDANKIIAAGLTQEVLQFKALEAWLDLSKSPNSKVIITNGTMPMMMNPSEIDANTQVVPMAPKTSTLSSVNPARSTNTSGN